MLAAPEPIGRAADQLELIKVGAKVVSHDRYFAFQMAEVAIPRQVFQRILRFIAELLSKPPSSPV
jgi:hypothetical protein